MPTLEKHNTFLKLVVDALNPLIESHNLQFILCGSSARKLKTEATNLLGGRAWVYHFYPLTFAEIPNLDLLKTLKQGLIPNHYSSDPENSQNHSQAYVDIYLNENDLISLENFLKTLWNEEII